MHWGKQPDAGQERKYSQVAWEQSFDGGIDPKRTLLKG
jgi:hypothetical protein